MTCGPAPVATHRSAGTGPVWGRWHWSRLESTPSASCPWPLSLPHDGPACPIVSVPLCVQPRVASKRFPGAQKAVLGLWPWAVSGPSRHCPGSLRQAQGRPGCSPASAPCARPPLWSTLTCCLCCVLCAGQWEGVSLSRVSRRTRCRFVSVDVKADARRRLRVLKMDGHRQLAPSSWCSHSRGPDCPLMGTRAASIGFTLSDTPV